MLTVEPVSIYRRRQSIYSHLLRHCFLLSDTLQMRSTVLYFYQVLPTFFWVGVGGGGSGNLIFLLYWFGSNQICSFRDLKLCAVCGATTSGTGAQVEHWKKKLMRLSLPESVPEVVKWADRDTSLIFFPCFVFFSLFFQLSVSLAMRLAALFLAPSSALFNTQPSPNYTIKLIKSTTAPRTINGANEIFLL